MWRVRAVLAALGVIVAVGGSLGIGADVPTWRVGDTWNYQDRFVVTIPGFSSGWLAVTDWQRWSVVQAGEKTQQATGKSFDVYDVNIGAGDPPAVASGWYRAGTRIRAVGAVMRGADSHIWFRRSDLAMVRRRRCLTGTVQWYQPTQGGWVDHGEFLLDEISEADPALELFDFPTHEGESWALDGGVPGGTIHAYWLVQGNISGLGGGALFNTGTISGSGTVTSDSVTSPTQAVGGCELIDITRYLTVTITLPETSTSQYQYWYNSQAKNYQEMHFDAERYGEIQLNDGVAFLQSYQFAPTPAMSLDILPQTAAVGSSVLLSGTTTVDGPVTVREHSNGLAYDTVAAGGTYSLTISCPYATDPTGTTYDLGSVGLLATDAAGEYVVQTLAVTGSYVRDDDDPGDRCQERDYAYWRNFDYSVSAVSCPDGPFQVHASVEVLDMSDSPSGSCQATRGLASGLDVGTASWLRSEDGGATWLSEKDVAIYSGGDGPQAGWLTAVDQDTIAASVREAIQNNVASVKWFSLAGSSATSLVPDGDAAGLEDWLMANTSDGEDDILFIIDEAVYTAFNGTEGSPVEVFINSGNTLMHTGHMPFYFYQTGMGTTVTEGKSGIGKVLDAYGCCALYSEQQTRTHAGVDGVPSLSGFISYRPLIDLQMTLNGWVKDVEFAGGPDGSDAVCYRHTVHGGRYCHIVHGGAYNSSVYVEVLKNWLMWQRDGVTVSGGSPPYKDEYLKIDVASVFFRTERVDQRIVFQIRDSAPVPYQDGVGHNVGRSTGFTVNSYVCTTPTSPPSATPTPFGWTATSTAIPTMTSTLVYTYTATPSPVGTMTPTATGTASATATATVTLTPSMTPTAFPTPIPGWTDTGWMVCQGNGPLTGLSLYGRSDEGSLAGLPATLEPSSRHLFAHIPPSVSAESALAMVDPGPTDAHVTLDLYGDRGTLLRSRNVTVRPNAQWCKLLSDESAFGSPYGGGWLRVTSDAPILAFVLLRDPVRGGLAVVPGSCESQTLFLPHFHCSARWWTGVAIANPNPVGLQVRLTAFGDDGSLIAQGVTSVSGHGRVAGLIDELLSVPEGQIGWLRAESNGGVLGGMTVFVDREACPRTLAATAATDGTDRLCFSQVISDARWWTGVAIVNFGDIAADLLLSCFSREGLTLDQVPMRLEPGTKLNGFVSDQVDMQGYPQGWLDVTSSAPLIGMEVLSLSDDRGRQGLAGIEAQRTTNPLYVPRYDVRPGWWTFFAVANADHQGMRLSMTAYGVEGGISDTTSVLLARQSRLVDAIDDLFGVPKAVLRATGSWQQTLDPSVPSADDCLGLRSSTVRPKSQ